MCVIRNLNCSTLETAHSSMKCLPSIRSKRQTKYLLTYVAYRYTNYIHYNMHDMHASSYLVVSRCAFPITEYSFLFSEIYILVTQKQHVPKHIRIHVDSRHTKHMLFCKTHDFGMFPKSKYLLLRK
jgi:hypothetical protein